MEVDVLAGPAGVVFGATGLTEIMQNVRTILATQKGSVPLDREFGVDTVFLDEPAPVAMTRAVPEIIEAVEKYEPRVKVTGVEWVQLNEGDAMDGKLVPRVRIKTDGLE